MDLMLRGRAMELTTPETIAVVWVIVLAFFFVVTAAINLRASDPRGRGVQLASLLFVLALMTVAFAVSGAWAAAVVLGLALCAEVLHLVFKRRRVA